jgi:hypothetical protein
MLVVSGATFYSAYDAISTGITKAPGRNNNHYVLRSAEPHVFHSLVSFDIGAGIFFAVAGIAGLVVGRTPWQMRRISHEPLCFKHLR